jgi:peroxiredoxin
MCNLRLQEIARELPPLRTKGLEAIAFFHSSAKRIAKAAGSRRYSLHLAADPERVTYTTYGVEESWPRLFLSTLRPAFYADWIRSMRYGFWGGIDLKLETMPADFLIDPQGSIARAYYGSHIGDHLSVDEIAQFVRSLE